MSDAAIPKQWIADVMASSTKAKRPRGGRNKMRHYHIKVFSSGFKVLDRIMPICRSSVYLIAYYRMSGLDVRVVME